MIELIQGGVTSCVDSSKTINYNGTALSEVWVCDTTNAVCCRVWTAKSGLFVCSLCSSTSSDFISSTLTALTAGEYTELYDGTCLCVSTTTSCTYDWAFASNGYANYKSKIYVSNFTGCPVHLMISGSTSLCSCYTIAAGSCTSMYTTAFASCNADMDVEIPNGYEGQVTLCIPVETSLSGSSTSGVGSVPAYARPVPSMYWCLTDCDCNAYFTCCSYSTTAEWCCCIVN